jgi:hypothetical protein
LVCNSLWYGFGYSVHNFQSIRYVWGDGVYIIGMPFCFVIRSNILLHWFIEEKHNVSKIGKGYDLSEPQNRQSSHLVHNSLQYGFGYSVRNSQSIWYMGVYIIGMTFRFLVRSKRLLHWFIDEKHKGSKIGKGYDGCAPPTLESSLGL